MTCRGSKIVVGSSVASTRVGEASSRECRPSTRVGDAPSAGGNAKTLMFVNVSSSAEHHMETKSSLQFAQKVNGCDVGPVARGMPKTPPRLR